VSGAERRARKRLRALPLTCVGGWRSSRPIYHVVDRELRAALATARPELGFWEPPCDLRQLSNLVKAIGLTRLEPGVSAARPQRALKKGLEEVGEHFVRAVDHLSNELGREGSGVSDTDQHMK
jgi:hypothetical protein